MGVIADEVAEFEFDDSAAHVVDGAGVVGGHNDGGAGAVDLVEEDHDAVGGFGVEVAGGFVSPVSRLEKGSSSSSRLGSVASARARATRCCSPPESSWG